MLSLHTARCFSALSSSPSTKSKYQCRVRFRVNCCSRSVSVEQEPALPPPQIKPPLPPEDEVSAAASCGVRSGIQVPRQRFIPVSKSELLDAVVSGMFDSEEEATHFLALSRCLESILHTEHKTILEEMRADFDLTLSPKSKIDNFDGFPAANYLKSDSVDKQQKDEGDTDVSMPSGFNLDFNILGGFSFETAKRNAVKNSRVAIPGRFQRAFMKLLYNAEFEELSPWDLMLTAALNTDYLLTLPIYVDWKRASESSAIIFRRGYAIERQKGLLIGEKLDYLQSKLLQNIFFLTAKPFGRVGVWLNEVFKSIYQKNDIEVFAEKISLWIKEASLSLGPRPYDEKIFDDRNQIDTLSSDFPIWTAAQKAVTRYEGILSDVGPRERLLRKFLAWAGLVPSTPEQAFDLNPHSASSESKLSSSFLSRKTLGDIWRPASRKSCGNDFGKMLKNSFSILFSQSILQEPAFQELILLYTDELGEREATDEASEVPSLHMKIYGKIPVPDLPVVFPHKKLSFRILDTVRLDVATIVGLLAYFFSYKFEDILSSPSAIPLDLIAVSALVLYVFRVLLGYKQTRDRYQLLVNKTLYEKTVASGFGSIHFLLDASEQQQYKEAILVYATLLKAASSQVTNRRALGDRCEMFIYDTFQEKIEMPVDKAIETLVRLGLVIDKVVGGHSVLQAMPCSRACIILRDRWNSLIN